MESQQQPSQQEIDENALTDTESGLNENVIPEPAKEAPVMEETVVDTTETASEKMTETTTTTPQPLVKRSKSKIIKKVNKEKLDVPSVAPPPKKKVSFTKQKKVETQKKIETTPIDDEEIYEDDINIPSQPPSVDSTNHNDVVVNDDIQMKETLPVIKISLPKKKVAPVPSKKITLPSKAVSNTKKKTTTGPKKKILKKKHPSPNLGTLLLSINDSSIMRMCKRSGLTRVKYDVYGKVREVISAFMSLLIKKVLIIMDKRKIVCAEDVLSALKEMGINDLGVKRDRVVL